MNTNFIFNRFLLLTGLNKKPDIVSYIFELGHYPDVSKNKIRNWSKINQDTSGYAVMPDQVFVGFIRGLLGYIRIQQADGIDVFNIEKAFTEEIITMFFDYRNKMSEKGIEIFKFD